jgi:hypothetical protein
MKEVANARKIHTSELNCEEGRCVKMVVVARGVLLDFGCVKMM